MNMHEGTQISMIIHTLHSRSTSVWLFGTAQALLYAKQYSEF